MALPFSNGSYEYKPKQIMGFYVYNKEVSIGDQIMGE
jgi:hypothetical protein